MSIVLKIAVAVVSVVMVWDMLTRKYLNPFKLYFIFGAKGAGKTITETKLCVQYMRKGWLVYTDMPELLIPGVRRFNWHELGDFVPEENSLLILSEVGTKFDKRNFKDFKPSLRDFFVFQRKYKVVCYMDSQSYDVDIKIRDRCDGMYLCQNVLRVWCVAKRIYKHPEIIEASGEQESRIVENLKIAPLNSWLVTFIPAWCNLYDTGYIIDKKPYLTYAEIPPLPSGTNRRARKVAAQLEKGNLKRERKRRRQQSLYNLIHEQNFLVHSFEIAERKIERRRRAADRSIHRKRNAEHRSDDKTSSQTGFIMSRASSSRRPPRRKKAGKPRKARALENAGQAAFNTDSMPDDLLTGAAIEAEQYVRQLRTW